MIKKYFYPASVLFLFTTVFLCLPSYFSQSEPMRYSTLAMRDVFFKIRHATSPRPDILNQIVIVPIDEESCSQLGARWPWSRKVFASIVNQLKASGARVVGLNVSFSGFENEGETSTAALAEAMKQHGHVVVGTTFDAEGHLMKPNGAVAQAADGVGYLEKIVDPDLAIRRSYLLRPYLSASPAYKGAEFHSYAASFPLEIIRAYKGLDQKDMYFDANNGFLKLKGSEGLWLDTEGSYTINYLAAENDFKKISAWRVAQGKFNPADVSGKLVLIGLGSSLFSDMHPTPFGLMPGIVIHANEFASVLSGRRLQFAHNGFVFAAAWFIGVLVLALYLMKRFWIGILASLLAFFGVFLGAQIAFARDFVTEPFILLLGPFFATLFGILSNSFRLLMENKGLETKVIHDKMTGLYKYEYLRECLEEEWKRCKKGKFPVSIAMTDLDRFKKINDTLGHEVGNEMIVRAGNVIKESARRYDIVSRYGGDEFVVLLWHASLEEAKAYRTRLRELYHAMAAKLQPELQDSSISIGVASFDPNVDPNYPPDAQRLVEDADKDLFMDKESRRKGPSR